MAMSPPTVARSHNLMDGSPTLANGQDSTTTSTASPPSMKISNRVNYGELFVRQFNKNGNKLTATASSSAATPEPSIQSPEATPPPLPAHVASTSKEQKEPQMPLQQQQQQKSSRRTTSLLNLFMSNSQGKQTIFTYHKKKERKKTYKKLQKITINFFNLFFLN